MSIELRTPLSRRNLLTTATLAIGGVGFGLAAWPLLAQLRPAADDLDQPAKFNLSEVGEGTQKIVKVHDNPVVIRHRSSSELAALAAIDITALRRENPLKIAIVDAPDENRAVPGNPAYIVFSAACPREGCVLVFDEQGRLPHSWQCPCCGSWFDGAGRAFYGPAPHNLAIPRYDVLDGNIILFL